MGVHNEDHEYLVFLHYLYIESFSQWFSKMDEYKPRYRDIMVEIHERCLCLTTKDQMFNGVGQSQ